MRHRFGEGSITLTEGKLYALQNSLRSMVGSAPMLGARAVIRWRAYLLTESDAAPLIDTGSGKDEP